MAININKLLTRELIEDYPDVFWYIVSEDSDKRHLSTIRAEFGSMKNACKAKGGITWCCHCEDSSCVQNQNPEFVHYDDKGYLRFNKSGKLVHRYVAERILGRKLKFRGLDDPKSEVVHHKNGKKDDNHPDNLQVLTNKKHHQLHEKQWRKEREEGRKGYYLPDGSRLLPIESFDENDWGHREQRTGSRTIVKYLPKKRGRNQKGQKTAGFGCAPPKLIKIPLAEWRAKYGKRKKGQ